MPQIIYILTNEAMPGYVKIGKTTTTLEQRVRELSSSTSVPLPFTCFYACSVPSCDFVEKQLHEAFGDNRINPKREFFKIAPSRVVAALKIAEIDNLTPGVDIVETIEDQIALDEARRRRPPFRFSMANILPGSELTFVNDTNIRARVIDDRKIEFNNEIMSPSYAAAIITGNQNKSWPAGTIYWMYGDETLDEIRTRIESEKGEE